MAEIVKEMTNEEKRAHDIIEALLYIHAEIIQLNEANEYDPASFAEYSSLVREAKAWIVEGLKAQL